MNKIKIAHQTLKRVRFNCSFLSDNLNTERLSLELNSLEGVTNVRINAKAKSIVIETLEGTGTDEIYDFLTYLDLIPLKSCDTFLNSCKKCVSNEEPSVGGIIKASAALASTPFFTNNNTKFAITTAAGVNLFLEGTKELFKRVLHQRF